LTYTFLWRGFTQRGALWALYGSTVLTLALVVVSPLISGSPLAAFPNRDFHWTGLVSPGLVTVPAGFLLGWLGSVLDRKAASPTKSRTPHSRKADGLPRHKSDGDGEFRSSHAQAR
jgi:cation/acetate symporter